MLLLSRHICIPRMHWLCGEGLPTVGSEGPSWSSKGNNQEIRETTDAFKILSTERKASSCLHTVGAQLMFIRVGAGCENTLAGLRRQSLALSCPACAQKQLRPPPAWPNPRHSPTPVAMRAAGKRGSGGQGGEAGETGPLHLPLDLMVGEGKRKGTAGKLAGEGGGPASSASGRGGLWREPALPL